MTNNLTLSSTTLTAVQSERKPNSFLGAGDRQDKEESPPITINPISGFESPTLNSSKTPVVGKDIPSQPPTSLAELHIQMAKAFEGAFNMEPKETGDRESQWVLRMYFCLQIIYLK